MKKIAKTKHNGCKIEIYKGEYENGRIALVAYTSDGELYSDVSTNAPEIDLEDDEILVKEDCEDSEIAEILEKICARSISWNYKIWRC